MKLSIITVNLNNRNGLQKTIDSVVAQTFRDFEWIVIDGGSTDGSKELIEQYTDQFAYWVSEPDKGIYNAMNKGIKVAKGEYLQFLNSGDWLCDEKALERCFSHGFNADIVYGNLFFSNNGIDYSECYKPERLSFRFLLKDTINHNASFIKRNILVKELYDEELRIASDWKFFLIQALHNKSFEYINEFIIVFDRTGISATNKDLNRIEREKTIQEEVPDLITADYRKMVDMESQLNSTRVRKVIEYSTKNKLYRKIITASLLLIGFFEKVLCLFGGKHDKE